MKYLRSREAEQNDMDEESMGVPQRWYDERLMVVMGSFTGFQVRATRETAGRNRDTVDEVQFCGS